MRRRREWERMSEPIPIRRSSVSGGGAPNWAEGADLWFDFANNVGTLPAVTDTHAQTIYALNAVNTYLPFTANVLTRTNIGLQTVPTRTNLCIRSQEFDNAAWTKSKCTVTADQAVAPDGTTTAESLVEDNTTGVHYAVSTALTIAGTTTYTISVYAKEIGSRGVGLEVATTNFGNGANALFNRDGTDAVGTYGTGFTAVSRSRSGVLANGYRLYQFQFQGPAGSVICFVYPMSGGNNSYEGDSASGLHIWQYQAEAGAFASPPIPTTTASVAVTGNQQAVTGLETQLAVGVAGFIQVDILNPTVASTFPAIFTITDSSTTNNRINVEHDAGNFAFTVRSGAVLQASFTLDSWATGLKTIAFAVSTNYAMARIVNGGATSPDTTVTYPVAPDRVMLGGRAGDTNNNIYQRTKKITLKFGPQDQSSFDAMFAKAQLA